jgi:predicted phosphodiesterase
MGLDRIALISDVHGNLTALEAVLADIASRGIERVFNLGDYVGKGPREGRRWWTVAGRPVR